MNRDYPQFRALGETGAVYAIEGPKHATEWQPLGAGAWLVHQHFAHDYPSYCWVQGLLEADGQIRVLTEGEWETAVAAREVRQGAGHVGRQLALNSVPEMEPGLALDSLTTFGVAANASVGTVVRSDAEVRWALREGMNQSLPVMILGGGSNVLMHRDWPGLMVRMDIQGIHVLQDRGDEVDVVVGAGEVWHAWVMHALEQGWYGLENMALIPGSVGASPMQNIGAYGAEVKDRFLWLEAIHRKTGALERFDADRCAFGYRESIFKQSERDQWVIVRVAFRLHRDASCNIEYGAIREELQRAGKLETPTHRDVAEAVMRIRRSKLPDPAQLGNAGSFFKNPTLSAEAFAAVQARHPDVVHYALEDGTVKLAAGWLIDQAGWKGHRRERCGVHDRQALVLVNHGGATGAEVWALAQDIMADVHQKFGVSLEPEVNQIGAAADPK